MWEIEDDHVDLAEMVHRTVYVERGIQTHDGMVHRHVDTILLGADAPTSTRGMSSGHLQLQADGRLTHHDGTEFSPAARQKEMLDRLNGLHKAARAYALRHGKRILGPKTSASRPAR